MILLELVLKSCLSSLAVFKVLDIPLTVKMRTGISDKKTSWNAHKLISNLKLWDVSLVTVSQYMQAVIFVYSSVNFLDLSTSLLFSVDLIREKSIFYIFIFFDSNGRLLIFFLECSLSENLKLLLSIKRLRDF